MEIKFTEQQRQEIALLETMPEDDIDTSDIAPLTEEFWNNAELGKLYRPIKSNLTSCSVCHRPANDT
jgi:mono/diheme cytochrome c family protein